MNAGHFRLRLMRRFDDTAISASDGFVAIRAFWFLLII